MNPLFVHWKPLKIKDLFLSVCYSHLQAINRLSSTIFHPSYLNSNRLLSCNQFKFRKGHSTDDQLLFYSQVLGYCVDVVYLYFCQSFDLDSHDILVGKSRSLGVDASMLEWEYTYLWNPTKSVVSSRREFGSGVL